ncbi:hypothetical protein FB99_12190 [Pantoea agglomerans]|nr:hypothetical protein FB99_12190 [Pantoea agglomerans]
MADRDEPSLPGFHYNRRLGSGKTLQRFSDKEADFARVAPRITPAAGGITSGSCSAPDRQVCPVE